MSGNVYPAEPRIRWDYSQINDLLIWAMHNGMSDLCLRSGLPAWMRLNGAWRQVTQRPITTDELLAALERLTRNNRLMSFPCRAARTARPCCSCFWNAANPWKTSCFRHRLGIS